MKPPTIVYEDEVPEERRLGSGLYMPDPASPDLDDPPECRKCGGGCCTEFTLPGGTKQQKYIAEHFPYFHKREDKPGYYRCDRFADGRCSQYEDRPFVCRDFPSVHELHLDSAKICPLVARLYHERYGDFPEEIDYDTPEPRYVRTPDARLYRRANARPGDRLFEPRCLGSCKAPCEDPAPVDSLPD